MDGDGKKHGGEDASEPREERTTDVFPSSNITALTEESGFWRLTVILLKMLPVRFVERGEGTSDVKYRSPNNFDLLVEDRRSASANLFHCELSTSGLVVRFIFDFALEVI